LHKTRLSAGAMSLLLWRAVYTALIKSRQCR